MPARGLGTPASGRVRRGTAWRCSKASRSSASTSATRSCASATAAPVRPSFSCTVILGQDDKPAERVINADPDAWYRGDEARMGAENFADWRRAIHDPATVHAMCEDYRAGLTVDRAGEESDRAAGRRVRCPTLFLWSEHDDMEELYGDPLAIWSDWAEELSGARIACGHHMAEEAPEALAAALREFFMPLATRSSA
jgi:pimeloyl-ACP methyl ester carboxylesterase